MKLFNTEIILGVLKSWPVIATAIAFLLVINFASFIIKYRKKPPKSKKKKAAPAPKPQPQEGAEGGEAEASAEE